MTRKICVISGSRAEYGLLYWLMRYIQISEDMELQIIVTGMHLSPEFGLTYRELEKDGFKINKKIEIILSSDSPVGVSKSMGLALISFGEAYYDLNPDMIIVLGDRFEILSAVIAAFVAKIPIAHLHGGELTEGAMDDAFRHSITKMSQIHFVANEEYRKRVIQLGEQPDRVYNVGGLGIDNIKKTKLLTLTEFEDSIQYKLLKKSLLITYHPVTFEIQSAEHQMRELLDALSEFNDISLIFTMPNADTDGRIIMKMIEDYVRTNKNAIAFKSLGKTRYLSAIKYVDAVVGNSSSGLAEVPSLKKGTINIGDRQKGRLKAKSVIDCNPDKKSIINAINKVYTTEFSAEIEDVTNPYGDGGASEKIINIIKDIELKNILKKQFYDL